jgi:hypothetical protein
MNRPYTKRTWNIWNHPWVIIAIVAIVGVPAVFLGISFVAFLFANPVSWFLIGAGVFWLGFRQYRNSLIVRNTPTSRIDAAAIGLVEVCGRVVAGSPLIAPISGKPCVYWQVKAQAKGDKQTQILADRHGSCSHFEVEDETGRVLVWPWDCEIVVTNSQTWQGDATLRLTTPLVADAVRRVPHQLRDSIRVTEKCIEAGKPVYVLGTLSERRDVAKRASFIVDIRNRVQNRQAGSLHDTQERPPFFKVLVLAIAMTVWWLIGSPYGDANQTFPGDPPEVDPHQVMIWRGNRNRPFVIGDAQESVIRHTLNRWSMFGIAGGAGIMIGTLIYWLGDWK